MYARARSVIAAVTFCLGLAPMASLAERPDWLPNGIALPEPHEVVLNQKIGANTYLIQAFVEVDPTSMLSEWKQALLDAGYDIDESMLHDGRLLFSSSKVEAGQIAVQSVDAAEFMIQIDMTMTGN